MSTIPGGMPLEEFLREYWQKKPLLVKQAIPDIPAIDPNELAGYALEKGVESRLIVEQPNPDDPLLSKWSLTNGPLTNKTFKSLPSSHWTLLVQAVNQLNPAIYELLERFRFIPSWRIDDVMVSYAADQGGVGPHFDYYDVFLLQASGKRHWRLGQNCSSDSPLRADTDCKILKMFETSAEWLVEPGDLLYIPPGLAHWGVAEGECLTYSVGFRAPSYADILLDYSEEAASMYSQDYRFVDPDRQPSVNPGLIDESDLAKVRTILQQSLLNDELLASWFGRFMTQSNRGSLCFELEAPHPTLAPGVRAAYHPLSDDQAALYINGEEFHCSLSLAQALCSGADPTGPSASLDDRALVDHLADEGYLA